MAVVQLLMLPVLVPVPVLLIKLVGRAPPRKAASGQWSAVSVPATLCILPPATRPPQLPSKPHLLPVYIHRCLVGCIGRLSCVCGWMGRAGGPSSPGRDQGGAEGGQGPPPLKACAPGEMVARAHSRARPADRYFSRGGERDS